LEKLKDFCVLQLVGLGLTRLHQTREGAQRSHDLNAFGRFRPKRRQRLLKQVQRKPNIDERSFLVAHLRLGGHHRSAHRRHDFIGRRTSIRFATATRCH
jgi:hypothetical protein